MAFKGQSECAVPECKRPRSVGASLCQEHFVSGMALEGEGGTCIVTAWCAEHANESGIIFLNDYAMGNLFGGASGFKAKLEQQGFVKVRNLGTPEEVKAAKAQSAGSWSGPWSTEYPWEATAPADKT